MSQPVKVPRYPGLILTPPTTHHQPSASTLSLLRQICRSLIANPAEYSVTYSPLLCPEGKNHLFTLKPYYWEVAPGKWDCETAKGQSQLQSMALAVNGLSLGARFLPDLAEECTTNATRLLEVFFLDRDTCMIPQVLYSQCDPSLSPMRGDGCFCIAARYLLLVSQALLHLHLPPLTREPLLRWLQAQVEWMQSSPQGSQARSYDDNKSMWYHALLLSHLAILSPSQATTRSHALFTDLSLLHPTPQSFFAKDLLRSRPRHYVLFCLEPTFVIAPLTAPNAGSGIPAEGVVRYLEDLVGFARTVRAGEIEREFDNDLRYGAKLAWFDRMLARWKGEEDGREGPDASGWEGGWDQRSRLNWGLV